MRGLVLLVTCGFISAAAIADDLENVPIRYSVAALDNPVSRLNDQLAKADPKWEHNRDFGYLPAVLKALEIPKSSQTLVFSKTSFQRDRITPKTPRALYFNDEVYLGFCLRGDVLEFSTADPNIGTAFFTLSQDPDERPRFIRQTDNCLACHASSMTRNSPGHVMRSVYPDSQGQPILSAGTYRTDPSSPFEERFGGWYVSGTHGSKQHLGNLVFDAKADPSNADRSAGQNVADLSPRFTAELYPTPHSDLVALMVLTHQLDVHNRMAYATIEAKRALYYQEEMCKALGEPADTRYDSVTRRLDSAANDLLDSLLFVNEHKLTEPIAGTSAFQKEFEARGPADRRGRSLRQFELKTRLFRYPCSYLILSRTFDQLPAEIRSRVIAKLNSILDGSNAEVKYSHLDESTRNAIREILVEVKPEVVTVVRK